MCKQVCVDCGEGADALGCPWSPQRRGGQVFKSEPGGCWEETAGGSGIQVIHRPQTQREKFKLHPRRGGDSLPSPDTESPGQLAENAVLKPRVASIQFQSPSRLSW